LAAFWTVPGTLFIRSLKPALMGKADIDYSNGISNVSYRVQLRTATFGLSVEKLRFCEAGNLSQMSLHCQKA